MYIVGSDGRQYPIRRAKLKKISTKNLVVGEETPIKLRREKWVRGYLVKVAGIGTVGAVDAVAAQDYSAFGAVSELRIERNGDAVKRLFGKEIAILNEHDFKKTAHQTALSKAQGANPFVSYMYVPFACPVLKNPEATLFETRGLSALEMFIHIMDNPATSTDNDMLDMDTNTTLALSAVTATVWEYYHEPGDSTPLLSVPVFVENRNEKTYTGAGLLSFDNLPAKGDLLELSSFARINNNIVYGDGIATFDLDLGGVTEWDDVPLALIDVLNQNESIVTNPSGLASILIDKGRDGAAAFSASNVSNFVFNPTMNAPTTSGKMSVIPRELRRYADVVA